VSDVGLIVSRHATDALRRRDPEFAGRSRDLIASVCYEVHEALRQGRLAAHRPRWTRQRGGPLRRRDEKARAIRFACNADDTHCYVLIPARKSQQPRNAEFSKTWVVMSVLVRRDEEREAA
jgi:hypothetical protein